MSPSATLLIWLALFSTTAASEPSIALSCAHDGQEEKFVLPSEGLKFAAGAANGWLELEESGLALVIAESSGEALNIPAPFRYGWRWKHIESGSEVVVRRFDPTAALGHVNVSLHCSMSPALLLQLDWLQRANSIAAKLEHPIEQSQLAPLLAAIDQLRESAPDGRSRALALHLRAQSLLVNGRSADASEAFKIAEQSWLALHDSGRALAARVGRIEELYQIGDLQSVLDLTNAPSDSLGAETYFSVRLQNNRCVTLQALGKLNDAEHCYEWVLAHYDQLGENTEYVTSLQNYASVQRDLGKFERAQQLGRQALASATGPNAPMVRGRLRVMLGSIALSQGNIAESLSQSNLALDEFAHARETVLRWQANTYLNAALLFAQLGAHSEAYDALGEAVTRISFRDAPSRMAVAMSTFADLERDVHNTESAIVWKRAAQEIYTRLNMPAASDTARADWLEMEAEKGDINITEREINEHVATHPLSASKWLLLSAELAILQNRETDARFALDEARSKALSLPEQIRATRLDAQLRYQVGDSPGALGVLLDAAKRSEMLLQKIGSPVIRYLVARQFRLLESAAFRQMLTSAQTRSAYTTDVETVWAWLVLMSADTAVAVHRQQPERRAEQFDREVAVELLAPAAKTKSAAESKAQRELLSLLAQPDVHEDAAISTSRTFPLEVLRDRLDADSAFIAYLDGESHGALLWVTHDTASVVDTSAPDEIRTSVVVLRDALRSPATPMADVQSAAQTLSAQLLRGVPGSLPPKHLLVLADELTPGIAWNMLTWPSQSGPLLDSTSIELVRLAQDDAQARPPGTSTALRVIVASQRQAGDKQLASLATANAEPLLIQAALAAATLANPAAHPISIADGAAATREAVLSGFAEPGAWVHIAAHGTAQPQRIGYAGLWLEPSGDDKTPAFLSWLDILDKGVRADLVVLNACQLGDSGNAINGNLSFAAAVSRAGAKQVVAALWPVSDSAAALWVPAFYAALAADPEHNAAAALRVAQLRLRASRAFAHPFFWAGMQATARLSLAAPASVVASAQKAKLH